MLNRIMGPTGSGKTKLILRLISEKIAQKKKVFLIVPEQVTAEYEKKIIRMAGNTANEWIEITNFSRLSNIVLRSYGSLAQKTLSDSGKKLLLGSVLFREAKENGLFRAFAAPDAIEALQAELDELNLCGLSAETMLSFSENEEFDPAFREKLSSLASLSLAFKASLSSSFLDPTEEAVRLSRILENFDFFGGSSVFLDAFWDFTAPQEMLLRQILRQADEVTVSFICEPHRDSPLFRKGKRAAQRLYRIANEVSPGGKNIFPEKEKSPRPEELSFLASSLLQNGSAYPDPPRHLHLTKCASLMEEAQYIASTVSRLVREGAKWNDFAVLTRNDESHAIFSLVLEKNGIPHFLEKKDSLAESPIAYTVLSSVQLALGNLSSEKVRDFLRRALLPCEEEELFLLQRYADTWSLSGRIWMEGDFRQNPNGLVKPDGDNEKELEKINHAKKIIFTPLKTLSIGLCAKKNAEKLEAIRAYLTSIGLEKKIALREKEFRAAGDFDSAGREVRLWNATLTRLGEFYQLCGEDEVSAEDFFSLLRLALSGTSTGQVPPSEDIVQLGTVNFTRPVDKKFIFIPCLSAGVFPAPTRAGVFFTASEREALQEKDIPLGEGKESIAHEYFLFGEAVHAAGEELFLSYSPPTGAGDENGATLSLIGQRVRRLFPKLEESIYSPKRAAPETKSQLLAWFCRHEGEENPAAEFLKERFLQDEALLATVRELSAGKAFSDPQSEYRLSVPFEFKNPISYSRLESFSKCHYSYFLDSVLHLKAEPSGELKRNAVGSFVHEVMEKALVRLYEKNRKLSELGKNELEALNRKICREVLEEMFGEIADARIRFLLGGIEKSTLALLKNLQKEFDLCDFQPVLFEKEIYEGKDGYSIPLSDGTRLYFRGSIDRVDLYENENGCFVRVVDYKTGGHSFSLEDVENGVSMQMLIYLFSLWESGVVLSGERKEVLPAGVVYLNGMEKKGVSDTKDELQTQLGALENASFTREGILLKDEDVLRAQDPENSAEFVPAKFNEKKNSFSPLKNSLLTLEEMGKLKKRAERKFASLVMELKRGNFEAKPLMRDKKDHRIDPCSYCAYRAICKNDNKDPARVRKFQSFTPEEILSDRDFEKTGEEERE